MTPNETDGWTLLVIAGLTVVTVLTRSFFFISSKPWHLPEWARRGLQYAPIAALAAVIAPEILMTQGELIATLKDARIWAALAAAGFYVWKRGTGYVMPGLIAVGLAVFLPLRLGLGW